MDTPPPLPSRLYVPALRQFLDYDPGSGGYVVNADLVPDEDFLVQLSRMGLLGESASAEDDALYALMPLTRTRGPEIRSLIEGPRQAAWSGVFTVEVGGGYDPIDPRGGHGPEGPRRI